MSYSSVSYNYAVPIRMENISASESSSSASENSTDDSSNNLDMDAEEVLEMPLYKTEKEDYKQQIRDHKRAYRHERRVNNAIRSHYEKRGSSELGPEDDDVIQGLFPDRTVRPKIPYNINRSRIYRKTFLVGKHLSRTRRDRGFGDPYYTSGLTSMVNIPVQSSASNTLRDSGEVHTGEEQSNYEGGFEFEQGVNNDNLAYTQSGVQNLPQADTVGQYTAPNREGAQRLYNSLLSNASNIVPAYYPDFQRRVFSDEQFYQMTKGRGLDSRRMSPRSRMFARNAYKKVIADLMECDIDAVVKENDFEDILARFEFDWETMEYLKDMCFIPPLNPAGNNAGGSEDGRQAAPGFATGEQNNSESRSAISAGGDDLINIYSVRTLFNILLEKANKLDNSSVGHFLRIKLRNTKRVIDPEEFYANLE